MYNLRLPALPLRPYIESYWKVRTLRGTQGSLHEQIFVDGQADILFNFGCAYKRCGVAIPCGNLDGQRDYPVVVAQQGEINLVGVRFQIGGLAAFTRLPLCEIANQVVDLYNGLGATAESLEYQLYEAADFDHQSALLDSYFLARLNQTDAHALALRLAGAIQAACGQVVIQQLSADAGYSIRTVDRLFRQYIGLPPRLYARIQRFQNVLRRLNDRSAASLTQIALNSGYYDQSHFTHEFVAFAGVTPTAFRQNLQDQELTSQSVQFLQDF